MAHLFFYLKIQNPLLPPHMKNCYVFGSFSLYFFSFNFFSFQIQVSYDVGVRIDDQTLICNCKAEETVNLLTIRPFDVSIKLESLKVNKLELWSPCE